MDETALRSNSGDTAKAFASQAMRKAELAHLYIELAEAFAEELKEAGESIESLIGNPQLRQGLLTAVGLSEKAKQYFTPDAEQAYLTEILEKLNHSSRDLKKDLLFRFLLTSGDSLGGRSRNLIGREGSDLLIEAIKRYFETNKIQYELINTKEDKIAGILWDERIMLFDNKPLWLNKNIDVILLNSDSGQRLASLREDPASFLACGEIKGGADPAGSDEHWKTAKSALDRIRESFVSLGKPPPPLFFAGLAIVPGVADEIVLDLRRGRLSRGVNLARDDQVKDLVRWLLAL